jgi:ParB-like chromosome segregation protein Spo0J
VEKLKKKIDKGGNIPDIKVTNIEGKWMVVDGNHRLAAMKEILSEDTKVPVKKLI